ncbi:folylpolyglutamate synthase, mitochondrial-like [Saccoglossus kowalevskii]|uniref:tetrahydrofolate synthase n=1 Tax=Saccoglossus kowalevskii TaxID=10224 RepID=A0ABM0H107_SACKO|nr:PREDICTED: folylpolyglutamate synthase, mitochondrial-like [Saccoglossus kowalevskii]
MVMLKTLCWIMRNRTIVPQCHSLAGKKATKSKTRLLSVDDRTPTIFHKHASTATAMEGEETITKVNYEDAVRVLNTLQTNSAVLDKIRKEKGRLSKNSLPEYLDFLDRADITLDDIDDLSIIHVSGTKGKGSVCAFCESILRANGFKTGFYSSPHLVEVRERIRINGLPLKKDDFSRYFFNVYNKLESTKDKFNGSMPAYFRFLTIMAFHVFMREKVDVAIVEVGIGGAYDCTNVVRYPIVTGISSLGMDHTKVLGDTLDKIAWHKTGICKPGRPAFTVLQPKEAMDTVITRATELQAPIQLTPDLSNYDWQGRPMELGLAGEHQQSNASLAIQLCRTWIEEHKASLTDEESDYKRLRIYNDMDSYEGLPSVDCTDGGSVQLAMNADIHSPDTHIQTAPTFKLPDTFIYGLRNCYWAGRTQTITRDNVTYYLDGAHTPRSISACVQWFKQVSAQEERLLSGRVVRVLVFNSTGDRDERSLMEDLIDCDFSAAAFCPNIASVYYGQSSADQANFTTTTERQLKRCKKNRDMWQVLEKESGFATLSSSSKAAPSASTTRFTDSAQLVDSSSNFTTANQKGFLKSRGATSKVSNMEGLPHPNYGAFQENCTDYKESDASDSYRTKSVTFDCIVDALQWAACAKDSHMSHPRPEDPTPPHSVLEADHIQVLVTGSLHLVGGVIKVLDPDIVTKGNVHDDDDIHIC